MDSASTFLVGRLTADPKVFGEDKTKRAVFTVAINRGSKDNRKTSFINVIAWGKRADHVEQYATKGVQVVVVGELEEDSWTNDEGQKRSRTQVNVNQITIFNQRRDDGGSSNSYDKSNDKSNEELAVPQGSTEIPF